MKIYMMGDSTMKYNNIYTYPQVGWGQVLHLFAKNECLIEDHAENGRSTKSFIEEKRFEKIYNKLEAGDYVICQFGHNDEKINDPTRYTTPFDTYQKNLNYFADMVKEKNAHIIFATPITRHKFENGKCINSHGDYPKAMLEFALNNGYTCIDLNKITIDLYNQLGEEKSKSFHMIFSENTYSNYPAGKDDHSHLRYEGAITIAKCFINALFKTNDRIKECFLDLDEPFIIDEKMLID